MVYLLTFPNGKKYVGQTKQPLIKRITQHCCKSSKCTKLCRAIIKYNKEFTVNVLYQGYNLTSVEEYYIAVYNTIEDGYNILSSQDNKATYGFKGKRHSEEYKRKMKFINAKPIVQYDLNGNFIAEYLSLRSTKMYGFNPSKVCMCLKGNRLHHKNFIWKYKN